NHRRSKEPAGAFKAHGAGDAASAGVGELSQRAWLAPPFRWRMYFAATVKPIARPMPATSIVANVASWRRSRCAARRLSVATFGAVRRAGIERSLTAVAGIGIVLPA